MASSNPLNVYLGSDSVRNYYDPDIQQPLPLIELPDVLNPYRDDKVRIYAKMMTMHPANNVKAYPAMNMLSSSIVPGKTKTVIEYSSGSTVISMSILSRVFHGINDTRAFLSNKTSEAKLKLMQFFGLGITLFGGPSQPEPSDARGGISRAEGEASKSEAIANPNQYENDANWQAHLRWTGPQILKQLSGVNVVCAGMGTSGTMTGIGRFFNSAKPSVFKVGVCTAAGDRVPGPRSLALLSPVQFPWREAVDAIEEVGSTDSYALSMELSREGLVCGPSSGLNLKGLYQFIDKRKSAGTLNNLAGDDDSIHCVFVCCDLPYQYINEYFSKLDQEYFVPIQNQNLAAVDLYRYDEAWERDAADTMTTLYDLVPKHEDAASQLAEDWERLTGITTAQPVLKPQTLLIDFRTAADFALWHLPEAVNIPLLSLSSTTPSPFYDPSTLESQWRELESLFQHQALERGSLGMPSFSGKSVFLICYDGDTARVATSVLHAKGVEAYSIRGGLRALERLWPDLHAREPSAGRNIVGAPLNFAALADCAHLKTAMV